MILNNNVHTATPARTDDDWLSMLTNGVHHVVTLRYAGTQKRTVQLMQTYVGRETSLNTFNMRRDATTRCCTQGKQIDVTAAKSAEALLETLLRPLAKLLLPNSQKAVPRGDGLIAEEITVMDQSDR